ncbi:MAG: ATP-dependent helicase, partial [Candidatus Firestonebacteria bacterium]|nr:ATP-dependent helicase [Candidatus Firestonebacteria bacterium]
EYKYIMVDEYQDTNKLQGDITYLLGEIHRNVMIVGDDAQSIYGFRGGSHDNIMQFPKKFPECKIIKLEENYRSTQSILDLSNAVLKNMINKYSKCLFSARKKTGDRPIVQIFENAYDEAEWIAIKIRDFRNSGIDLNSQGVLFRTPYVSIPLQAELSRMNIPYQVFGGLKFYETAHVKDVMAHLKIIVNIKDELAWNRVLLLIERIGHKTAEQIIQKIKKAVSYKEIIENVLGEYKKGYKYSEGLNNLASLLRIVTDDSLSTAERFINVVDYYSPIMENIFDDWALRFNDLDTIRQISGKYDSLEKFLHELTIELPDKNDLTLNLESQQVVEKPLTLSTIHSAKGLEWDVVFIIGIVDGILPVSFTLNDEYEIEEERRLFYVGVTRARNYLYLSMHYESRRNGMTQYNKISRFVNVPNILAKIDQQ